MGVLLNIKQFNHYTRNSTFSSATKVARFQRQFRVEPQIFTTDLTARLRTLQTH